MSEELKDSGAVTALSVVGLVFGLIGMLGSFIPCIGSLAFYIGIPAAIVSGIALWIAYTQKAKRTFAIVAIVISLIGVVISAWQYFTITSAGKHAQRELQKMASRNTINKDVPTKSLPKTTETAAKPTGNEEPEIIELDRKYGVLVNLDENGRILINNRDVPKIGNVWFLRRHYLKMDNKKIFIKVDKRLQLKNSFQLIVEIKRAGFSDLGLIDSEKPDNILDVKIAGESSGDINKILSSSPGDYAPVEIPDNVNEDNIIILTLLPGDFDYINKIQVFRADLGETLKSIYTSPQNKAIYLRVEGNVRFNEIMKAIETIKNSEIKTICLILEYFTM